MHISQDREEIYFQYPHIYTAGECFRRIDTFESRTKLEQMSPGMTTARGNEVEY